MREIFDYTPVPWLLTSEEPWAAIGGSGSQPCWRKWLQAATFSFADTPSSSQHPSPAPFLLPHLALRLQVLTSFNGPGARKETTLWVHPSSDPSLGQPWQHLHQSSLLAHPPVNLSSDFKPGMSQTQSCCSNAKSYYGYLQLHLILLASVFPIILIITWNSQAEQRK